MHFIDSTTLKEYWPRPFYMHKHRCVASLVRPVAVVQSSDGVKLYYCCVSLEMCYRGKHIPDYSDGVRVAFCVGWHVDVN